MRLDSVSMKDEIAIKAYAKINIGLDIGPPRGDGFHPILGLFHSLDIADKLAFSRMKGEGIVVEGEFDCPTESTTIYKAAELFLRKSGADGGLRVAIEKRIPVMGGLGGGSADAAATIMALDTLCETKLGSGELFAMAGAIGSDVPFFLTGGAAIVSGRGEIIEPIVPRTDIGILLVHPGFGVSTKWAYAALDSLRKKQACKGGREELAVSSEDRKARLVATFRKHPDEWDFRNSFVEMLYAVYPVYAEVEAKLRESGAAYVSITGSGSCMYGIYASMGAAAEAEAMLISRDKGGNEEKTLYGMALHAIKPLETSLYLG